MAKRDTHVLLVS